MQTQATYQTEPRLSANVRADHLTYLMTDTNKKKNRLNLFFQCQTDLWTRLDPPPSFYVPLYIHPSPHVDRTESLEMLLYVEISLRKDRMYETKIRAALSIKKKKGSPSSRNRHPRKTKTWTRVSFQQKKTEGERTSGEERPERTDTSEQEAS